MKESGIIIDLSSWVRCLWPAYPNKKNSWNQAGKQQENGSGEKVRRKALTSNYGLSKIIRSGGG
ncbi:MAG: hypothetical protein AABY87_04310 [bacterium]